MGGIDGLTIAKAYLSHELLMNKAVNQLPISYVYNITLQATALIYLLPPDGCLVTSSAQMLCQLLRCVSCTGKMKSAVNAYKMKEYFYL